MLRRVFYTSIPVSTAAVRTGLTELEEEEDKMNRTDVPIKDLVDIIKPLITIPEGLFDFPYDAEKQK